MIEELIDKFNYKIELLHMNNIVLIPGKQEESLLEVYNKGYFNNPYKYNIFPWNYNMDVLHILPLEKQKEFLNLYFYKFKGKYLLL